MNEKQCNQCKGIYPLDNFYRCKGYKDGIRSICKPCFRSNTNKFCKKNRKKYRGYQRKRREIYRDHINECNRKWWENRSPEQIEKMRIARDKYRKNNMDKFRLYANTRNYVEMLAKPKWANDKYMDLWRKFALMESERTGRIVHIDHIIPLQNKYVCGLNCEDNMQLLFKESNLKKFNKFDIN